MTGSRVGVLALARETFDVPYAEALAEAAFGVLDGLEVDLVGSRRLLFDAPATEAAVGDLAGVDLDLLLVMQVSFTDASMMQVIGEQIAAPIALWGFPEPRLGGRLRLNAFCGINLAAFALRRLGRSYRYLHRSPTSEGIAAAVRGLLEAPDLEPGFHPVPDPGALAPEVVARAAEVRDFVAGSRIGVIGEHPVGFDPCAYDPDLLQSVLGVTVERVELGSLFDAARAAGPAAVDAVHTREAAALDGIADVDQGELRTSLSLFPALSEMAASASLAGLAVRCWPEAFTEFGGAVCASAALMNDERTPTACEADVHGSISAVVLQALSGGAALVADLVDMDPASDTGVLWHCGKGPLSMADPDFTPLATVHSNRRKPLLHEFPFKPGRITIGRFSGSGGEPTLVVGGGEMLAEPLAYSGTAGVVRFDAPIQTVMDTVMGEGLDHHYGFTYGDFRSELRALAGLWGIRVVEL